MGRKLRCKVEMPCRNARAEEVYRQDYQVPLPQTGSHYPASPRRETVSIRMAVRQRPEPVPPRGPGTPNTTGKQTPSINKREKTQTAERSSHREGNWKVAEPPLLRRHSVRLSDGQYYTPSQQLCRCFWPWVLRPVILLVLMKGEKVRWVLTFGSLAPGERLSLPCGGWMWYLYSGGNCANFISQQTLTLSRF